LGALVGGIAKGADPAWLGWTSLVLAVSGIGLAGARTVRNAVRLGRADDSRAVRTDLARTIYRDHLFCLAVMTGVVLLQVVASAN